MIVRRLLLLVGVSIATLAGERAHGDDTHWLTHAAFRNDVLSSLDRPVDDAGFTHDNVFSLRRITGDVGFGGSFLHRWLTSRVDRRRWDQVELLALAEHRWSRLVVIGRLGPVLGGNFGGRRLQNGWHELTGWGPTLEEGLQSDYPDARRAGVLAGGRARVAWTHAAGRFALEGATHLDGQLALHTGVSSGELGGRGTIAIRHLALHVEAAISRYRVSDPMLALPGGYRDGFQLEWRAGLQLRWSRFALGYEYRANEGGSGEPVGVVAFSSRR